MEPIHQDGDMPSELGISLPLQPISRGRKARHLAIRDRVLELTVMDHLELDRAILKALDELDPVELPPQRLNFLGVLIVCFIAAIVLAFLLPVLGFAAGHLLMPLWRWGFGWAS